MNHMTELINEKLEPQIKKYSDILSYLKDYYEYRKSIDDKFNYDQWSAELGFKSRSFMYLICSGRRPLTTSVVTILGQSLKLNSFEKTHLLLLASYHRAHSEDLKSIFLDKILESLEQNEKSIQAQLYSKFVNSRTMPLVKMILSFDDVKGTVSELLSILPIERKTLLKDLTELEKMGLIKKNCLESSREVNWKATSKAFKVSDDQFSEIMSLFNLKTLNEAAEVTKQKDLFKRFRTILFAIDPKDHDLMLSEIEGFLSKMKNRFGYNDLEHKHIMKLNLQAYPVTKTLK